MFTRMKRLEDGTLLSGTELPSVLVGETSITILVFNWRKYEKSKTKNRKSAR